VVQPTLALSMSKQEEAKQKNSTTQTRVTETGRAERLFCPELFPGAGGGNSARDLRAKSKSAEEMNLETQKKQKDITS